MEPRFRVAHQRLDDLPPPVLGIRARPEGEEAVLRRAARLHDPPEQPGGAG